MKYSITFQELDYNKLVLHLFSDRIKERAAYALCRISKSSDENRLLVTEIIPVAENLIEDSSEIHMKIKSISFLRAMKKANETKQSFVFIHSHPDGYANHSVQDDKEEQSLFKTAYNRIRTNSVHASIVLSSPEKPVGRVYLEDGTIQPITMIRVIGERFRFFTSDNEPSNSLNFFDRQIRAFGIDIQNLLQKLHIAIVGVGGTGSAIAEELIRLGVGNLTVIDGETFEKTNINRVYGSRISDDGIEKVEITKRLASEIGLGTSINTINQPISFQSVVNKLKNADIIFGCTDDQWGRSILTRLAVYYGIPVFDMGVRIDSNDNIIKSVEGRVTTLLGGYACLFCRERINEKAILRESLAELNPNELDRLIKAGYADELENPAPAVISFTSTVASLAITELLHRLTGFMGKDRTSNEVLIFFDQTKMRTNRRLSNPGHFCGDPYYLLRGDTTPLLDTTWRDEKI